MIKKGSLRAKGSIISLRHWLLTIQKNNFDFWQFDNLKFSNRNVVNDLLGLQTFIIRLDTTFNPMHQSTSITSLRSLSLFVWCQHDLTPIVNVNIATRDLTLGTWQNNYRPKCNFTKMHTFEIVSGRLLGLLSTCECKISKTSEMAAANRSRLFLQEKWQENDCRLLLKWMYNYRWASYDTFSNLQKSQKCYDIDESGMICGTIPLPILY